MRLLALCVADVPFRVAEAINHFCADHGAKVIRFGGSWRYYWQFPDDETLTLALLTFANVPLRVVDTELAA
jgi:hypothetical protein